MNVVDHRILIPRSPDAIWDYISDLSHNPEWQVDCTNISFLSSRRDGAGVRWRYSTRQGREYVAETTAWYDKLGYEYTFVDGSPFRESKGRIRLQEIAEGTIVQWTFNYEVGGLLGGMRNAVGLKRQTEGALIDSLKTLWKVIQEGTANEKVREIKSLMRDAPDYEARAHYKSRHPSNKAEQPANPTPPPQGLQIVEPPLSEEDTRPRAPVKIKTEEHAAYSEPEQHVAEAAPSIHTEVEAEPLDVPMEETVIELAAEIIVNIPDEVEADTDLPAVKLPERGAYLATTEEEPVVTAPSTEESREVAEVSVPAELQEEQAELSFTSRTTQEERPASVDFSKMSTAEVSVFDLFGLPRPSQTQEMQSVVVPNPTPVVDAPVKKAVEPIAEAPQQQDPQRIGMRLQLRRKQVKLRRPG